MGDGAGAMQGASGGCAAASEGVGAGEGADIGTNSVHTLIVSV